MHEHPHEAVPADARDGIMLAVLWPLGVVAAGIAVYLNSFAGSFLFDDVNQILGNVRIRDLGWPWPFLAARRPLVELSLAVNYALHHFELFGYHAVNLTVHLLAAVVLYALVRRTLRRAPLSDRYAGIATHVAGVVALIWVVHPLQTQAVTYLIQRSESLMALLYLLTLYFASVAADARRPAIWQTLCVIACGLGMTAKAVMITAPLMVLLYDRAFIAGSFRDALVRRARLYTALAGTWLILWLCGVAPAVLGLTDRPAHVGFGFKGVGPLEYGLTQFGVLTRYLRLAFWPRPLCLDYDWPVADSAWQVIAPMIFIFAVIGLVIRTFTRHPRLAFPLVGFFVILAPTSTIVPIRDPIFEHRLYLPLAGIITLLVLSGHAGLSALARWASWDNAMTARVTTRVVTVATVLLGVLTITRNGMYHDPLRMWRDVVAKAPRNGGGHLALGTILQAAGRLDEAITAFRDAVAADPQDDRPVFNLGNALRARGEASQAQSAYRTSIALNPRRADAHLGLGVALMDQDRLAEAEGALREAISLDPRNDNAFYNLGLVLTRLGRSQEAVDAYRACIRINPKLADAHSNLAVRLATLGEAEEAETEFQSAIRADPAHAKAHYNYGVLLLGQDRFDAAVAQFRLAIDVDPDYANAYHNLGVALWRQGLTDEAVAAYRRALKADPDHAGALEALRAIEMSTPNDR